jgi:hypothetical protein
MPSGSLHRPRRSCRPTPKLLATLLLALALAEPANADSLAAEEIQDAAATLAAEGVEAPVEMAVPEVSVEVPDPAAAVEMPDSVGSVEMPDPVEAVEAPDPVEPVPAEPPPEAAPVAEPPAPPAEPPAPLGARGPPPSPEPAENRAATQESVREALALIGDAPKAQMPDLKIPAMPMNLNMDMDLDLSPLSAGNDGDASRLIEIARLLVAPGRGETSALGGGLDGGCLQGNWTWDGACLPQNLGGVWPGGDRPGEDRLDGLLKALLPEGMGLAEAVGGPEPDRAETSPHRSGPRRSHAAAVRANQLVAGSAVSPPGGGELSELSLVASAGASGKPPMPSTSTAGGASGPEPVRDPASEPPEPPALAAGLAPGTGGGGGGAFFVLLIAALVGGLALVPPPSGERVHALARRLHSLVSSSRLERPG